MKIIFPFLFPVLLFCWFCSPVNEKAAKRSETTTRGNSEKLKVEEKLLESDSGSTLTAENKFILIDSLLVANNMTEFYERLIDISGKYSVIKNGVLSHTAYDDSLGIFIYTITLAEKEVLIVINTSNSAQQVSVATKHSEYFRDLLNDNKIIFVQNGGIGIKVEPNWGSILLKDYFR